MKSILISLIQAAAVSAAWANTAPTPVIVSAAMRPGTTLMDVVFRVNDPDDATVKVRALAFVDGVRSFAKVLRPVTFVEGTTAKIGDAIASNTDHTLTWDVAADWNIDLGQVKFEILARDGRGLLAFDWIAIPTAGGNPALTISKDAPSDASVLDALFWQYADGDTGLTLTNGVLTGNANSGTFANLTLASGIALKTYAAPYIFKRMNIDPASSSEVNFAAVTARAGVQSITNWHAANRSYAGISTIIGWGSDAATVPPGLTRIIAIAARGSHSLALQSNGTVAGWGGAAVPSGLSGVIAISAGGHDLALKSDGTVIGWGGNGNGQTTIPAGLTGVTAIAAGGSHSLALKSDGTVIGWGWNLFGQTTIPSGLNGVTAIAAGSLHSMALKTNGTVVVWGSYSVVPGGLDNVSAISAALDRCLALKTDGSVVGWGAANSPLPPQGLTGVIAIATGKDHDLALKSDGTVVGWGTSYATPPIGLAGVVAIAAGDFHSIALKAQAP